MKLDSFAQEDAQRLGEALVERARADADRLKAAAHEASVQLSAKARLVVALNEADEGTLLGATALYAEELTVVDDRQNLGERGWPLEQLELRFPSRHIIQFCGDRNTGRRLAPGRYRALLVFTRIDE